MTHRGGDIKTLFQRLTPLAVSADRMTDISAARAIDEWPLLAMLAPSLPVTAQPSHHMMMPLEEPAPAPTQAADRPLEAEPLLALELEQEEPDGIDEAQLSPLEQLFRRAERTGKPQAVQRSVFAPPETQSTPLDGPPPLKSPVSRPATVAATRSSARPPSDARLAPVHENAAMMERRARDWHAPEMVPEHLFERIGGR